MKNLKIVSLIALMGTFALPTLAEDAAAPAAETAAPAAEESMMDKVMNFFKGMFAKAEGEVKEDAAAVSEGAEKILDKAEGAAKDAVAAVTPDAAKPAETNSMPATPAA